MKLLQHNPDNPLYPTSLKHKLNKRDQRDSVSARVDERGRLQTWPGAVHCRRVTTLTEQTANCDHNKTQNTQHACTDVHTSMHWPAQSTAPITPQSDHWVLLPPTVIAWLSQMLHSANQPVVGRHGHVRNTQASPYTLLVNVSNSS